MCVASLHASTQPCAHRWYQLVQPCAADTDLQNCPNKLKLAGWENKTGDCPWCDGGDLTTQNGTHRLLGNAWNNNSIPSSPTASDLSSTPPQSFDGFRTLSSLSTLSRHASFSSVESDVGQRHRDMNERLHVYLTAHPHQILPSASKNYPTYPQGQNRIATGEDQPRPLVRSWSQNSVTTKIRKSVKLNMSFLKS